MVWRIEYAGSVQRAFRRLDRQARQRLRNFLEVRLANTRNPRQLGAAMRGGKHRGLWRYRVGHYRVIAQIDDDRIRILVVRIAHRSKAYR
ncbi:MAG: type II toxin-antitoxin system RelE/ParE family toxin [Gammaproteobacteria bacterium]|nr:type II toxin-antitoxin system RelE/ParE family toxin [Gammaproteobacteria bacterium]MXW46962.1 type II toxin-antitoxin system RelE/ParE family toxin [Gammaproteobacteria bacterium]MYD02853.1 type II toxin-antitoxin system RelE/ParE family toxin [Gammaproteobacteria bacterium]MYI24430.1 type II toxin-antitoxin system RelE/ParE family toxin [Gammaproteobacteria bacterium]